MDRQPNRFSTLADQAQSGDPNAQVQLRRQLAPEMMFIVRRALRDGRGRTPLDRRILAEARHAGVADDFAAGAADDGLIHALAERVCALVLGALRPHNDHPAAETVCGSDAWPTRMPS